jgi:bacillithiol biosynthesis cysteine-adding enzyme BshC
LSLRIEVSTLRGGRLLDDYLSGADAAAAFYAGHPYDPEAYRRKLEEVRARFADPAARERASSAMTPTTPRAAERLRRFVREGGAMVTTGQQAGLFGGPLYTLHKALTAVRLAEALERELGVLVLPVFWVASEDHDFAEVNHAYAVDGAGELRRLAVGAGKRLPRSMSRTRLAAEVEEVREAYLEAIGAGDDGDRLRGILSPYRAGETVAGAFREALSRLFADERHGGLDLYLTQADDPQLKAASLPVLLGEAERAAEHERRVAGQTVRLEEAGYAPQVVVLEGATNLFYESEVAGRERLHREGGELVARESGRRFTAEEVEHELRAHPGRFSPNVFLRPVVESAVFPTLAYVGGPAETAYFAQIRPLFEAFGIRMPLVFPRLSATLVPGEAEETRAELGLQVAELALPEHEALERLAHRHLPPEVEHRLAELRRAVVEGFAGVMDAAGELGPDLALALGGRRNAALLEVARAERKVVRHFKQRHPGLLGGLRRVRNHLRPLGLPQERVLTVFQYLARRPSLLRDLANAMRVELGRGSTAPEAKSPK